MAPCRPPSSGPRARWRSASCGPFLGVVAFVAGLRLRIDDLRRGGLALLALATAKVFLFDLAALDVAYRVISLIALGLLLLGKRLGLAATPASSPEGTRSAPSSGEPIEPAALTDRVDPAVADHAET